MFHTAVGDHIVRRPEPNRVPEFREFAAPAVRAAARLDANLAGRQLAKKTQHIRALQLLA